MKLVKFLQDYRPHHGYRDVYVNPEEVAAVSDEAIGGENPTRITLRCGATLNVTAKADDVAKRLAEANE
jgi:hypothetical protein